MITDMPNATICTISSPFAPLASIDSAACPRDASSGLRILRQAVPPEEVRRANDAADRGGKHGRPSSLAIVKQELHLLIAAPVAWLHHEYYDPVTGRRDDGFFHVEREERLERYAALGPVGSMPPIYLTYAVAGVPWHGRPLAFVSNGNHRLEVAKRSGEMYIPAWIPEADAAAWSHALRLARSRSGGRVLQFQRPHLVFRPRYDDPPPAA